jgi:predicted RNase H-like nuclease (RuvC/YqgF family)
VISHFLQNAYSTKEELSADLLSCRERHQSEIETLEQSLKEKLSTVEKLAEERISLEGTVVSYKNEIDHLKLEMDESLRNQMETMDKLK